MHHHRARPTAAGRRVALAAALAGILTACGGGGSSDGPASPADTPARDRPLALSAANRDAAATLAVGYAGTALSMGQTAVDWIAVLAATSASTTSGQCSNGGSYTLTLTDRDNNGRPSAGDRLDVAVTGCWIDPLEDRFTGTLSIDLTAPPSGASWAGTVTAGPTFGLTDTSQGTIRLSGPLTFDYAVTDTRRMLHLGSGASAFVLTASTAGTTVTESISGVDVRRELDRETARNRLTLGLTASSDTLGSRVVLGTATPMTSWLNAYPDAGSLNVAGAGGQRVTVSSSGANALLLEFAGTGAQARVTDVLPAFVFSTKGLSAPLATGPYALRNAPDAFALVQSPFDTGVDPSGTLSWQYSQPVDADAVPRAALLRAAGAGDKDSWGRSAVALTWEVKGAWVTAKPAEQLSPGQRYDTGGSMLDTIGPSRTLPSASGRAQAPWWRDTVRATVIASASLPPGTLLVGPSASVTIDGGSSRTSAFAPAYFWRQISGPVLAFSATDRVSVTVSPTTWETGPAVVELEVRNLAGESDFTRVTVQVAGGGSGIFFASRNEGEGWATLFEPAGAPNFVSYTPSTGPATLDVRIGTSYRWLLSAPPQNLAAGQTIAYPASGIVTLLVPPTARSGPACGLSETGAAQILELQRAADGSVERLAVNIDQSCSGHRMFAQIRFNSTIPPSP
ncbi:hypothetical protein [Roseateles chitinivorans]|uniref:hypothetical protein n=1 Tax=Roseateles chitinivorans TaxID=2917965 RepID=UPI003D67C0B8